jgi:hypothetical protein
MMDLEGLRQRPDILELIEWDLTPQEAVEMFDHRARGLDRRLRVRSTKEPHYFFCVDNWGERPRLVLKERSVKEAKVIAEVEAPDELLIACVRAHCSRKGLFPLSDELQAWLRERVYG